MICVKKIINWKKEGFSINQKIFVTKRDIVTNIETYYYGKVIYVGTKILKVQIDQQNNHSKIIKFNGKNICRYSPTEIAMVYKSLNEYISLNKKNKEKGKIIESIINSLYDVSVDKLIYITMYISKSNTKKKKF